MKRTLILAAATLAAIGTATASQAATQVVNVNAQGTSPGCMSFPKDADCPPVLNALGLGYDGQPATGAQRFLRMQ